MGEMNGAHRAEIAVARNEPQHEMQAEVSGPHDDGPHHAGLDMDDGAHVVLRRPVLALGHFAQEIWIDRRLVLRGIAPLQPADPHDGAKPRDEDARQRNLDPAERGGVRLLPGERGEDRVNKAGDITGELPVQEEERRSADYDQTPRRGEGRARFVGLRRVDHRRKLPGQQQRDDELQQILDGVGHRGEPEDQARRRKHENDQAQEQEQLDDVGRALDDVDARLRGLGQPVVFRRKRGAQRLMDLRRRLFPIIGFVLVDLVSDRAEQIAFLLDAIARQAAIAVMERRGLQRAGLEIRRERRCGLGFRHLLEQHLAVVERRLAAAKGLA